ncbi:MAG: leucine-rich repeat protein [Bacilli bacterium]
MNKPELIKRVVFSKCEDSLIDSFELYRDEKRGYIFLSLTNNGKTKIVSPIFILSLYDKDKVLIKKFKAELPNLVLGKKKSVRINYPIIVPLETEGFNYQFVIPEKTEESVEQELDFHQSKALFQKKYKPRLSIISPLFCLLAIGVGILPFYLNTSLVVSEPDKTLNSNNFNYKYDSEGNATITRYTGSNADVSIPSFIGGYPVKTIGPYAFESMKINSVDCIASGLTIEPFAFFGCDALVNFDFEDVKAIKDGAFKGCSSLEIVNLPKLTYLGDKVFEECSSLSSVAIGYNEGSLSCSGIPFFNCEVLSSISVNASSINYTGVLWSYCPNVSDVFLSRADSSILNSFIDFDDNWVLVTLSINKFEGELSSFPSNKYLSSVSIANMYGNTISAGAFQNCLKLSDFSISKSDGYFIESQAFLNCTSLTSYDFTNVLSIGSQAFQNTAIKTAVIPASVSVISEFAFEYPETRSLFLDSALTKNNIGDSLINYYLKTPKPTSKSPFEYILSDNDRLFEFAAFDFKIIQDPSPTENGTGYGKNFNENEVTFPIRKTTSDDCQYLRAFVGDSLNLSSAFGNNDFNLSLSKSSTVKFSADEDIFVAFEIKFDITESIKLEMVRNTDSSYVVFDQPMDNPSAVYFSFYLQQDLGYSLNFSISNGISLNFDDICVSRY